MPKWRSAFGRMAGVADRITCVVGTIGDGGRTLDALANEHGFTAGKLDLLFIDHDKAAYPDLQSILDRRWLHRGSVVVADNILIPGSPPYREFMNQQQGKLFDTVEHKTHGEYQTLVPISPRRIVQCARGCAPAQTSRSACTVTIV